MTLERPRVSICEITTLPASFDEDLEAYVRANVDGIGIVEAKIAADPDAPAKLEASGLRATHCVPRVPHILPRAFLADPGPETSEACIDALCDSIFRLARLDPVCVVFVTGPGADRQALLSGIERVARTGREHGVPLALETSHPLMHDTLSPIHTIRDAVALLDEAGAADVGVMADVWHLGDSNETIEDLTAYCDRVAGVQLSDRRGASRNLYDRVLPGAGSLNLVSIVRTLAAAGFRGYWDIEIFSDDGRLGQALPDSLWNLEPADLAMRSHRAFTALWEQAMVPDALP